MQWDFVFFLNSLLLGVGLAMDAFSVSLANGLGEPDMKTGRMNLMACMYAFFQFAMPMIGWLCVHTIVDLFNSFEKFVPWIALALLSFIGVQMIVEGVNHKDSETHSRPGFGKIIIQAVATSIDALSVGFTIEQYPLQMALVTGLIIALVTYVLCFGGIAIGKKFGTFLADKASIIGGIILIAIGLEVFIRGI